MTPEEWRQVCDLFAAAVRRNPAQRTAFLDQSCAGRPDLRAEVERLLAADASTQEESPTEVDSATRGQTGMAIDESTLGEEATEEGNPAAVEASAGSAPPYFSGVSATVSDTQARGPGSVQPAAMHVFCPHCRNPIEILVQTEADEVLCPSCGSTFRVDSGASAPWRSWRGTRVAGRFELLAKVGTGGFGTVFKAHDTKLDRIVALKVLRGGELASDEHKSRFLREARNAAQLRHPAIVPVHEIGDQDGIPFIVSDYIEGLTVSRWLTGRRPLPRDSARLVAELARALHYAHEQGVIHRDVKPSNVMLDDRGKPHIMDFGLAKRDAGEITVTVDGEILGTPAYMSPEQARGLAHQVDGRSDVYSLGVILYLLLTGELPFRGNQRMLIHQVLNDQPRPLRSLVDTVPRDLETVCLKAMSKEATRRYATASELAADLDRYVEGEPIVARPVGALTKLSLWARRNPRVAALSSAVYLLSLLLALLAFATFLRIRADRAEARDNVVRLNSRNGIQLVQAGKPASALPWLVAALGRLQDDPAVESIHRTRIGSVEEAIPRLTACWEWPAPLERASFSPDDRHVLIAGGTAAQVFDLNTREPVGPPLRRATPAAAGLPMSVLAGFSPDGKQVFTVFGKEARVWNASTGVALTPPILHDSLVSSAAFDPAGRLLATGSGYRVHVRETASGRETRGPLLHPDMIRHVAFSPDGRLLLACYGGPEKSIGGASIWEIASPATQPVHDLVHDDDVFDGAFSPDGRLIVTSSYDKTARVWDVATGAPLALRRFESWVAESAFAADSQRVLSASGREARIWPVPYRGKDGTSLDHKATVLHTALSGDGARVVTCGSDRMARVWDVRSGELVVPPLPHNSDVNWASFSSDGRLLITASADRTARVWDLASGVWPARSLRHGSNVVHAAFGRDGSLAASISRDGILKLWNLSGEAGKPIVLKHGGRGDHLAFDPQGRYLATIGQDGITQVWDVLSGSLAAPPMAGFGKAVPPILFPDEKRFVAEFSARGSRLLTYSGNEALTWDWKSGRLLRTIRPEQGQSLTYATFSPDGGHILTCSGSGVARVWDALGEHDSAFRLEHQGPILFGTFSPDGALVLTTSSDRTGKVWDVATGKLRTSFAHGDRVNQGAFNPDGSLVVTASDDHTAAVWSSRTGKLAIPLLYHEEPVLYACFHKSGRLVATGCGGEFLDRKGEARIWDSTTGDPVTLPMRHGTGVRLLEFAGDGQSLLTVAYRDPAARIWSIPRARLPLADLTAMANMVSGVALDGTGGQTPLPAEELARIQRDLRSRHPERFSASKAQVLAWREAEARSTAGLGNWLAALPCYDALLQADPGNALYLAGRADSHASLGHWKEAARDMIQAIDAGSEDVMVWYKAALLCLKAADGSAYARLRQNLLHRYGDITESEASNALAYLCVLGPSAGQDAGRVVDISRRDVAASPGDYSFHNTLGAALYRAGEFNQSIREFEQAIKLHGKGGGHSDWLFLSMAHGRLGRGDEARRWFLKVDEQVREAQPKEGEIAREWHERVHLEILRGEAEKLLASDRK